LNIENNPEEENVTYREVPFSNEIYIEKDDFMEVPPKNSFVYFKEWFV
jgi:glutaminyl-tRNA synthetase